MLVIGIWMIVDTGIYLVAWLAYLTDGWSYIHAWQETWDSFVIGISFFT